MHSFIYSPQYLRTEVQALASKSQRRLWMVVAYWGADAIEHLHLTSARRSLRVVCDLRSGSCNPSVIRALWDAYPNCVRYLDGLHAKVYLGDGVAVVGSANASASGIGWEGPESVALVEAAIKIRDRTTLDKISRWIERVWRRAQPIDDESLKVAEAAWRRRRAQRPPSYDNDGGLLDRAVYVLWDRFHETTKKQQKTFEKWTHASNVGSGWTFYADARTKWVPAGAALVPVWTNASSFRDGVADAFDVVPDPVIVQRVGIRDFIIPVRTLPKINIAGATFKLNNALRRKIWEAVMRQQAADRGRGWGMFPLSDVMT